MTELGLFQRMLGYGDWANDQLLSAARSQSDAALDRVFDIGRGTLRKTLLHIQIGEEVWLSRWSDVTETKWGNESETTPISEIAARFNRVRTQRDAFFAGLIPERLDREQPYRDSRGSLFQATLREMIIQGIWHSTHHRAQGVNILRRLGAAAPELDFMMSVRKAV